MRLNALLYCTVLYQLNEEADNIIGNYSPLSAFTGWILAALYAGYRVDNKTTAKEDIKISSISMSLILEGNDSTK